MPPFAVGDGAAGKYEGFIPLNVACERVYRAITGLGPRTEESRQWDAQLDSVALSLCVVTRIYATDPLTNILFPVSEAELVRGSFQGGAMSFIYNDTQHTGLHVAITDLEDAIRILAAAWMPQRPHDPTSKPA